LLRLISIKKDYNADVVSKSRLAGFRNFHLQATAIPVWHFE